MRAVAYTRTLPVDHPEALLDVTLPDPVPGPHDLLVAVQAVSVNPVDVKMRAGRSLADGEMAVGGWDAAGVVQATGAAVTLFKPGDRVWYAGALDRAGSNSELQLVDARIAGPMPASLDFAAAAALPLTGLTAWELLFDRLGVREGDEGTLLVTGAAGGVGSILVQLARRLTGMTVIGTASRPETQAWVREMGAHHVIDHGRPLAEELARIGVPEVTHVASLNGTGTHFPALAQVIAPQGRIALIDDPEAIDVRLLKRKSASLHWTFMFTRSLYGTPDMQRQHDILQRLAQLVDAGVVRSTMTDCPGTVDAAHLRAVHAAIEAGHSIGKTVLAGFPARQP